MNKTLAEARAYVDELSAYELPEGVQAFLLPPHTALAAVRDALPAGSPILLGAQNAHWAPEGEATGEISMRMAADAGATLIEMGHSERRAHFGETDETVARKAAAAVAYGLTPMICVGEPGPVHQDGQAEAYVEAQLAAALSQLSPAEVGDGDRCLRAHLGDRYRRPPRHTGSDRSGSGPDRRGAAPFVLDRIGPSRALRRQREPG